MLDSQKAAVSRADRCELVLSENYRKPARHRKPKDKPKVENAVLVVESWILMRYDVFHTLATLNLAIDELRQELNEGRSVGYRVAGIYGHSNRAASPRMQNICRNRTASNEDARTGYCPGERASVAPPVQ
ncbi:hypothetical protein ACR9GP_22670 [Enterobacter ludwigii]